MKSVQRFTHVNVTDRQRYFRINFKKRVTNFHSLRIYPFIVRSLKLMLGTCTWKTNVFCILFLSPIYFKQWQSKNYCTILTVYVQSLICIFHNTFWTTTLWNVTQLDWLWNIVVTEIKETRKRLQLSQQGIFEIVNVLWIFHFSLFTSTL